jgi:hypothetical protein
VATAASVDSVPLARGASRYGWRGGRAGDRVHGVVDRTADHREAASRDLRRLLLSDIPDRRLSIGVPDAEAPTRQDGNKELSHQQNKDNEAFSSCGGFVVL